MKAGQSGSATDDNSPKVNRGSVKLYMNDPQLAESIAVSEEFMEKGHGRIEIRNGCVKQRSRASATTSAGCIVTGLAAFGAVDTVRQARNETSAEARHFIMSEAMVAVAGSPGPLANDLHRVLGVTMNEDGQRNRTGNGMRSIEATAGEISRDAPDGIEPGAYDAVRKEQVNASDAEDGRVG